jgi:hypothetical protein
LSGGFDLTRTKESGGNSRMGPVMANNNEESFLLSDDSISGYFGK